jgi:hypothetical protein
VKEEKEILIFIQHLEEMYEGEMPLYLWHGSLD